MKLTYALKLSGIFGISTALLCGILIFSKGQPDLNVLLYGFSVIIPASFIVGLLGYFMGSIFDAAGKKKTPKQFIK